MHSKWHILTILNVGRHITFWCLAFYKYGNGRCSICLIICGFNENDWYILYHLQWTLYSIQPNVFLCFNEKWLIHLESSTVDSLLNTTKCISLFYNHQIINNVIEILVLSLTRVLACHHIYLNFLFLGWKC